MGVPTKNDPRKVHRYADIDLTCRAVHAASIGDTDELKRLVARGHDLGKADYDGRMPLHLAAAEGRLGAVNYLLAQGVSVNPRDRWGNTPADDADRQNHLQVARRMMTLNAA